MLIAAAAVFLVSGVEASAREIAAEADVAVATVYRHFPTRSDLIIAVYREEIDACAETAAVLQTSAETPVGALSEWVDRFAEFLVSKPGLAAALQSEAASLALLRAHMLDRLTPPCAELLDAAAAAGETRADINARELLQGVGNVCIGAGSGPHYDARRLTGLLIAGLRTPATAAR